MICLAVSFLRMTDESLLRRTALTEWPVPIAGHFEPRFLELPPEDEVPYRGRERHPTPSREMARSTGRGYAAPPLRVATSAFYRVVFGG